MNGALSPAVHFAFSRRRATVVLLMCFLMLGFLAPEFAMAEKKVAVLLRGNEENAAKADIKNMSAALKKNGFDVTVLANDTDTLEEAQKKLKKIVESITADDKVMLYATGHGNDKEITWTAKREDEKGSQAHGKDGYWPFYVNMDTREIDPNALAKILVGSKANHINVMIEACGSSGMITAAKKALVGRTGVTVRVYTSARSGRKCKGVDTAAGLFGSGSGELGSYYTNGFLKSLNGANLDTDGDGKVSIPEFEAGMDPAHSAGANAAAGAAASAGEENPDPRSHTFTQ